MFFVPCLAMKHPGKKKNTDSFVCEVPLKVTQQQDSILLARFEAARQMYNACLGVTAEVLHPVFKVLDVVGIAESQKENTNVQEPSP